MESVDLKQLFGGCYAGRRVLITGHTGFKGSWLALWLEALGANVAGLALAPDTQPSHWDLLQLQLARDTRADLRDAEAVREAVAAFQPEVVFHLAAQALVRRSYREPVATFEVNVVGLLNVLEAVRNCPSVKAVVNATTDKVYEANDQPAGYSENDSLGGHDPYSASKACAELVSACYRRSFFNVAGSSGNRVRLATARAGNVVGGGDWAEDRLVPDLVRAALDSQPLWVRNPAATRPWQHVLEPLSGYLLLGKHLLSGDAVDQAWNFGPDAESTLAVGDVIDRLRHAWPTLSVEHDVGLHPHEAPRLALDTASARAQLGWRPVWHVDQMLERTSRWYRAFYEDARVESRNDLLAYVADARQYRHVWAI